MHTIKPIDKEAILTAAKETGKIITVEEHNLSGGLGSAVAEVLADEGELNVKMKRIALPDVNVHEVGSQQWLREFYHISAPYIEEAIYEICK
jgi:transketolase